jgi:hypothetical protein
MMRVRAAYKRGSKKQETVQSGPVTPVSQAAIGGSAPARDGPAFRRRAK